MGLLLLACRFSAKKNFFKFRVSPIVSGAVYVSYMVFLITVLDRQVRRPALAPCLLDPCTAASRWCDYTELRAAAESVRPAPVIVVRWCLDATVMP